MNDSLCNAVDDSINRTIKKIEELCPKGRVSSGLSSKDTYHAQGKVSLYTAAELLWALSNCDLPVYAEYLIDEIKNLLIEELRKSANKDRTLEESFVAWSLSLVHTDVNDATYYGLIEKISNKQFNDGGWGTCSKKEASVRATALCIIALSSFCKNLPSSDLRYDDIKKKVKKALIWLIGKFDSDYLWSYEKQNNFDKNTFIKDCKICFDKNSLVLYSFCYSINIFGDNLLESLFFDKMKNLINKSIKLLNKVDVNLVMTTSEIELEEYYVNNKLKRHDHGAGHLEFYILFIIEHKHSYWLSPNYALYTKLNRLVEMVLSMEYGGVWNDKNTEYLDRMWAMSYGIRALGAYAQECKDIKINYNKANRNRYQLWHKFIYVIQKPIVWVVLSVLLIVAISVFITNFLPNWVGWISLTLSIFPLVVEFAKIKEK